MFPQRDQAKQPKESGGSAALRCLSYTNVPRLTRDSMIPSRRLSFPTACMASDGGLVSNFGNPHSLVQTEAACNGLLTDISWAKFESLLYSTSAGRGSMSHHCNVARLVAMWQIIHYEDAYVHRYDMIYWTLCNPSKHSNRRGQPAQALLQREHGLPHKQLGCQH